VSHKGIGLAVALNASLFVAAAAQPVEIGVAGYLKDLAAQASSDVDGDRFFLNTARSRLQGSAATGDYLSADIWLDTELLFGSYLETVQYEVSRELESDEFADLDWTMEDTGTYLLRQSVFRLTATATFKRTRVVVGRQRIAWGTGFVWTPTDVLNPVSPVAIERDEKAGVDAVYVDYAFGPQTRIETVFAPSRDSDRTSVAGRMSSHIGEYDVAVMGGRIRDTWIAGGDFAGYLGNAGVRSEAAFTHDADDDFVRAVLNADYNFPGDYYAFVELHYNGAGTRDRSEYDYSKLFSGQTLNLAQFYAAASISKSLSPLVGASFYGVLNADDGSGLAGPALIWNAKENLELSASAYVFFGADDSEYGRVGNVYFVIVQYFF